MITRNIDTQEIAKFDAAASRWWDLNGEFSLLHRMNPLRVEFIQTRAQGLKDKVALDIGCGGGILAETLAKAGATVTAIDLSEASLKTAKLHLLESKLNIDYQNISAEEFALQHAGKFDVISCLEMLEHVPNPASIIQACATLLKPDGDLFFSTINRNPKSYLMAILGAEYVLNLVPKGTHDYAKFIKPSELDTWARASGLELQALNGIDYDLFSKKFSLTRDVKVNYIVHCRKTTK